MPTWFAWFVCFVQEVIRAFRPKIAWASLVLKVIGALAFFIAVFALANKVEILVTSGNNQLWSSGQMNLEWVAFGLAILVFLIWAIGAAWVRVFTLRVDDRIGRNFFQYQITIRNLGFTDTPVLVRMEQFADESGLREEWNDMLRLVLFNAPISRGLPQTVPLFTYNYVGGNEPTCLLDVADVVTGRVTRSLGHLSFKSGNKLWFRISISAINRSVWYSVQMVIAGHYDALRITREYPPHIQRMNRWRRWFSEES